MDLSVVVPTLNAVERLESTLDTLVEKAPDAEVIVVNGPSADGTTGMVREHEGVDLLLELSERNLNTSRNAGIAEATGDVICLVGQDTRIESAWVDSVESAISTGADVVTGPVHRRVSGGVTTESLEKITIAGRSVRYFDGGNVAFTRRALESLDGFDEYLETGGARDVAHRLAGADRQVAWERDAVVLREEQDDVRHRVGNDDPKTVQGLKFRSLAYRLAKNYGFRLRIMYRIIRHVVGSGVRETWNLVGRDGKVSEWLGIGLAVFRNTTIGIQDGLSARIADRSPSRNPHGMSTTSRPVARYER